MPTWWYGCYIRMESSPFATPGFLMYWKYSAEPIQLGVNTHIQPSISYIEGERPYSELAVGGSRMYTLIMMEEGMLQYFD